VKTCHGYWPEPEVPCLRMLRDGVCPKQSDPHHGYHREGPPDDPRWEWVDASTMSQPNQWTKGACRHLTPVPVETDDPLTGEKVKVAEICPDCDQQIWTWADDDLPEPNGFERWAYPTPPPPRINPALTGTAPSGLHLTSSPGAEWWRQLPKGSTERDVATINGKPVKVNQHGILVYDREPVYVAGGFIRLAPVRRPFWHRMAETHLEIWNGLKEGLGMSPTLFAIAVIAFLVGMACL
jgi:hypothetical protein